jgi:bacterioferritin-associated ferredoxin
MIAFTWNGRRLQAQEGDSAADALRRNGVRVLAATRKRHRPLGWSGSFVQGVLAEVDGVPNVRLDQVPLRPGLALRRQNAWPSPGFDLLKAFRWLPARWVQGGFEHPRWLASGTGRFERWERLLGFLAGEGRLSPAAPALPVVPGARRRVDALVVGAGPAGRAEAAALEAAGKTVLVVTRGPKAVEGVETLTRHEAFGVYRGGRLVAAAPLDPSQGALVIETAELVLATGRRSCPPVVPGNDLPGAMDAPTALHLAERGIDLGRVVVVGTGAEAAVGAALARAGRVVATAPVASLRAILGRHAVRAVALDRRIACETLVHAGPWIGDPGLAFQAAADGRLRLTAGSLPPGVRVVGGAAAPDEPVHVGDLAAARRAAVCPCMDVMGGEILDLAAAGMTHVEELKRQTGCGMGPCQGLPCWEMLRALLAKATGSAVDDRPSHRPPRRSLTVAQAAGLAELVEPQQ